MTNDLLVDAWFVVQNYGGRRGLYGMLDVIASQPVLARASEGNTMVATGMTPEAIEQNPIMYQLMVSDGVCISHA